MHATQPNASQVLAAEITYAASRQTYYTIRLLVDRALRPDAYRAYAYFRWVDDVLDAPGAAGRAVAPLDAAGGTAKARAAFLARQQRLLEACYAGKPGSDLSAEETLLADLVRGDFEPHSRLQSYLRHMMAVMAFDVRRRGQLISQAELTRYSECLATAVTDALFYFIGHDSPPPDGDLCSLAVEGAHIVHMLRDFMEDVDTGYINIPRETIMGMGISFRDVHQPAFRAWVKTRVDLASAKFNQGRGHIARVKNLRCRLAGFCYLARFEWMARMIEKDHYLLRSDYPERKSLGAGLNMAGRTINAFLGFAARPRIG